MECHTQYVHVFMQPMQVFKIVVGAQQVSFISPRHAMGGVMVEFTKVHTSCVVVRRSWGMSA